MDWHDARRVKRLQKSAEPGPRAAMEPPVSFLGSRVMGWLPLVPTPQFAGATALSIARKVDSTAAVIHLLRGHWEAEAFLSCYSFEEAYGLLETWLKTTPESWSFRAPP